MPTQPPGLPDFRQEYRAAVNNAGYYGLPTSGSSMAPMRYANMPFDDFARVSRQAQPFAAPVAPAMATSAAPVAPAMATSAAPRPQWTPASAAAPKQADVRMPIDYAQLLSAAVAQYRNYMAGAEAQGAQARAQAPASYGQYPPQIWQGGAAPPSVPGAVAGQAGQVTAPTYSGSSYGGSSYGASGWIDPVWYEQFKREHGGATPEEVYYKDKGYALQHALADKAWGDQFYQAMGRPPSAEDWRVSYRQRQDDYYGSF